MFLGKLSDSLPYINDVLDKDNLSDNLSRVVRQLEKHTLNEREIVNGFLCRNQKV